MRRLNLRRINDVLTVIVVFLCSYVLIAPFWPEISFRVTNKEVGYAVSSESDSAAEASKPRPDKNWLLIPSIGLDQPILGGGIEQLNKGVWHKPQGSEPDKGSNTVLVGHRFTYTEANAVFYHLDKISINDIIAVYWNDKEYNYQVTETKVVPATAVEIEAPTDDSRLTLYTCTPLWSAKDRLVIVAKLIYEEGI